MRGYDAWLEAPYVDAARKEEAFERWVEANDIDLDEMTEDEAWSKFEAAMEDEYESAMESAAEAAAEARAEREWDE